MTGIARRINLFTALALLLSGLLQPLATDDAASCAREPEMEQLKLTSGAIIDGSAGNVGIPAASAPDQQASNPQLDGTGTAASS